LTLGRAAAVAMAAATIAGTAMRDRTDPSGFWVLMAGS